MDTMLDIIDFTGKGVVPAKTLLAGQGGKLPIAVGQASAAAAPKAAPVSAETQRKVQQLINDSVKYHRQGKISKVREALEQVIEIDKENDQALFNLGIIYRDADQTAKAELYLRRAVKSNPERIDAYQAMGDLLFNAKHALSAVKAYESGLERAPNHLNILINLLRTRIVLRHFRDIENLCRRILAIEPEECDILASLAMSLLQQGKSLDEVEDCVNRALGQKPGHVRAMVMRERVASARGDAAAQAAAQDALMTSVKEGDAAVIRDLKEMYSWCDAVKETTPYLNEYLLLHPDDAEAESALMQTVICDGDFEEAQRMIEKLAAQFPDKPQLHVSRVLNLFRLGKIDEALPQMNCRWGRNQAGMKLDFPCPEWKGEEIRDGKLAIYAEQGVGDHVMYAGHMIPVRKRANHIVFEVSARQTSLFQRSFPDFEVIDRGSLPAHWRKDEVKAKIAAGDVAYVMGEDFRNLPGRDGFLIPHPMLLRDLRKKYQARFPGKILIGISWRSGNRDSAAVRSLELENWLPILSNSNCAFVSLQYGDTSRDIAQMKEEFGIDVLHDPSVEPMGNMDPFTAQVAAMDMVVSVDNSTIHYAAALGKPVWAMLPINSDWRWLTEGDRSIWYNSLLLLRQRKDDTWEGLVEKVGHMLANVNSDELHQAHVGMLKRCAETLQQFGRTSETEDYCRMLLAEDAYKDIALHGIAISALNVGKAEDAVGILSRAVELAPDRPELRAELAVALDAAGQSVQAERLARETLRQRGDSEPALIAMGRILMRQDRFDEATDYFARVLRMKPDHIPSRVRLAKLLGAQGEWGLARSNYQKALHFAPTSDVAHVGYGDAALRQGDWSVGWEHFGWRFGSRPGQLPRHLETIDPKKYPPSWDGSHLKRKRLLLRAERSLAEQLLFAPLLEEATAEARFVLAECDHELIPLLQPLFPKVEFVGPGTLRPNDIVEKRIQIQTSLGDLAARYRAGAAEFSAAKPLILKPDTMEAKRFADEYREVLPGRRLIGLSWRGGDWSVKFNPLDWASLFDNPEVAVVSLQRNAPQADLDAFIGAGFNMIVDRRGQQNLSAYAAQMAVLDGIIAVDDVTAHFGAHLGKNVAKPVSRIDHWCWGSQGAPQMWYKNLKAVLQEEGSETADVIVRSIAAVVG
ncbi:MAG: tetratricopeptide repeat protein [Proteobacteria bacterium]|nr:tetratricopeptide repeat protein [Pseudomonadota bacterium]